MDSVHLYRLCVPLVALVVFLVVVAAFTVRHVPETLEWLRRQEKQARHIRRQRELQQQRALVEPSWRDSTKTTRKPTLAAVVPSLLSTTTTARESKPSVTPAGVKIQTATSAAPGANNNNNNMAEEHNKSVGEGVTKQEMTKQSKGDDCDDGCAVKAAINYPDTVSNGVRQCAREAVELAMAAQRRVAAAEASTLDREAAVLILERAIAILHCLTTVFAPTDVDHMRGARPGAPSTKQLAELLSEQQHSLLVLPSSSSSSSEADRRQVVRLQEHQEPTSISSLSSADVAQVHGAGDDDDDADDDGHWRMVDAQPQAHVMTQRTSQHRHALVQLLSGQHALQKNPSAHESSSPTFRSSQPPKEQEQQQQQVDDADTATHDEADHRFEESGYEQHVHRSTEDKRDGDMSTAAMPQYLQTMKHQLDHGPTS